MSVFCLPLKKTDETKQLEIGCPALEDFAKVKMTVDKNDVVKNCILRCMCPATKADRSKSCMIGQQRFGGN